MTPCETLVPQNIDYIVESGVGVGIGEEEVEKRGESWDEEYEKGERERGTCDMAGRICEEWT